MDAATATMCRELDSRRAALRLHASMSPRPPDLTPSRKIVDWAKANGARLELTDDPQAAVAGADAVMTDCWVSMGDDDETHRHNLLAPYQVNAG